MADNRIHMPGAFGGLTRFSEEYTSKIMLDPAHVVIFIIVLIAFVIGLKIIF